MIWKSTITEVQKCINVVSPVININHAELPYRYLLVRQKGDKIEVKAYNDHIIGSGFMACYDLEESKVNEIYIPAKQFIGLINSFKSGEVVFSIKEDLLHIKCGSSNYKLPSLEGEIAKEAFKDLDIDYYSKDSFPKETTETKIKVDQFKLAYNSVNHCLSKDDSQKNLQSVYLINGQMLSCDSVRGASVGIEGNFNGTVLHKDACNCICNSGSGNEIALYEFEDKLVGMSSNFIFMTVLGKEYPYNLISPILSKFQNEQKFIIEFDPDNVVDKLNRVLLFADTDTNSVRVSIEGKEFNLSVENKAKAKETVSIFNNKSKEPMSLFVDGKNLREALSKSLSETKWCTNGESEVQFISDGSLLQFFNGLSS